MLGFIPDLSMVTSAAFKASGDIIAVLGVTRGHVGGSEYLSTIHGQVAGEPPPLDINSEARLHTACLQGIESGIIKSAHDCSEGGLAVALAECCVLGPGSPIGAVINRDMLQGRPDFYLFGEDQSRIVVTLEQRHVSNLVRVGESYGVPVEIVGEVGGDSFTIDQLINVSAERIKDAYFGFLEREMK